jgi:hypothetical protein
MIDCPNTGKPLFTGIDVPSLDSVDLSNNRVTCPHCGQVHTFDNSNVYLAQGQAPAGPKP